MLQLPPERHYRPILGRAASISSMMRFIFFMVTENTEGMQRKQFYKTDKTPIRYRFT
jgi:hypothetical protein